jgi:hypothetical protein
MESLDYWRLCDELTVIQAALLLTGNDPTVDANYIENWNYEARPVGYEAAKTAMQNAIMAKRLPATIRYESRERGYNEEPEDGESIGRHQGMQVIFKKLPEWQLTTVHVEDLRLWLLSRGFKSGFFFPDVSEETPDYLSDTSPHYAPKLAAAVNAWLHVSKNLALLNGKTPKQAIEKWLREHALNYGLTKEDGSPNEQGIEDIAKVANWKPTGGAAKTPSVQLATN